MARTPVLSSVLYLALAACGDDGGSHDLPDAAHGSGSDAAAGPVAVVPDSLTTLTSTCGDPTPAGTDLIIMNSGTADLVVGGPVFVGGFTTAATFPLTIGAGESSAIAITPPAAVIGTDLGGSTKTGTLMLTTNDTAGSHIVNLTTTIQGANAIIVDGAANPITTVHLDGTAGVCPMETALEIRSTGTLPVTIDRGTVSGFSGIVFLAGPNPFTGVTLDMMGGTQVLEAHVGNSMGSCSGVGQITWTATAAALCTEPTMTLNLEYSVSGASGSCFCS